jgi:hypothetical protein
MLRASAFNVVYFLWSLLSHREHKRQIQMWDLRISRRFLWVLLLCGISRLLLCCLSTKIHSDTSHKKLYLSTYHIGKCSLMLFDFWALSGVYYSKHNTACRTVSVSGGNMGSASSVGSIRNRCLHLLETILSHLPHGARPVPYRNCSILGVLAPSVWMHVPSSPSLLHIRDRPC